MPILVVKAAVDKVVKELGMLKSATFYEALSKKVEELIKAAAENAKKAKRKTIRPEDLP
ncbi:MAG: histone-like protein [Candidatus Asgardarchaeia archaeon]